MTTTRAVHQCLFCPQTFGSAADKDDHTLEHFAQETCDDCDQNLIRIGANLYTLHNAVTCIKREFKMEQHFESCYVEHQLAPNEEQKECIDIHSANLETNTTNVIQVKTEVETENQSEELQDHSHAINKLETPHTSGEATGAITGGQSDDEQIPPDDHGWLHSDSSMDSICTGELDTKTKSVLQYNYDDIPRDALREKPKEQLNFNQTRFNCTVEPQPKEAKLAKISQEQPEECKPLSQRCSEWDTMESHFCEKCSNSFLTIEELNEHASECFVPNTDGSFECNICQKKLSSIRTLKQHRVLKHTPAGTNVCRRCAKVFVTEKELEKHRPECISKWKNRFGIRKIVNANATVECYLCKSNYKSISSLLSHMRWKHTMDNVKYKCNICEMGFFAKSLQDMHMKRHNEPLNDQKVMCNVCGKFLTKGYSIKNHMKVHSGDKPFPCTHVGCSKSFPTKTARFIHLRSHNPEDRLKCPHDGCSKSFLSKPSLTIHLRSHSGEKPFKCPHEGCRKSFVTKSIIASHMLIHTGEKPFKCEHYGCNKEFRTKGARDRHMGTNAHK
ncbi:zinc finger protein 234-like [Sitodiplosis mosellana]|uniref:zinc finger protein 234-like n=1 Tax=Sitodiplosis mosellana TaxID=263140 RepID=UPI002443FD1A|nr:zinc finger protein 234-like [Sitodiplosis mosellana]